MATGARCFCRCRLCAPAAARARGARPTASRTTTVTSAACVTATCSRHSAGHPAAYGTTAREVSCLPCTCAPPLCVPPWCVPGHRPCHPVCACAPALSVPRPRCVPVHHRCPGRPACACAPPLSVPPGVRLCATAVRAARCVSVCVCQRTVAVRAARRASVRHRGPCRPACAFCLLAPLRPASPAARVRRLCAGRETAARHVSPFPSAAAT